MEYFDIVDENGQPTGEIVERNTAHREGIRHRTAHIWIVRKRNGRFEVLMQKRSMDKDSFPGQYDTSSAGHVPAGSEPEESALRELKEELGLEATADQLTYAGSFSNKYEKEFHGEIFRDNEVTKLYVYSDPVDIDSLTLQKSELDEVRWFDLEEVLEEVSHTRERICAPPDGLRVLTEYLMKSAPTFRPAGF